MITPKKAFTLVETMLVVALICLLATIAMPSFMKVRAGAWKSACQNSQVQLRDAISRYALTEGRREDDSITLADRTGILKQFKTGQMPCCPIRNTPLEWPKTFGDAIVCPVIDSGHDFP